MSFRSTNAPTHFMYLVNFVFMAELDKFVVVFIDNILTYSNNVTPTFYKNKKICANRSAYKNAYQIIVHMKNFPKINLV
jgi:hypothetical protein